jgi:hypothetical protein
VDSGNWGIPMGLHGTTLPRPSGGGGWGLGAGGWGLGVGGWGTGAGVEA